MSKRLLLARSDHDGGNHYLFAYCEEVIGEAVRLGWRVEKAENENAARKNFISRLANRPDFVFINGHGSESEVFGHEDAILLSVRDAGLLSGAVSFIRSCAALKILGKNAAEKGAKAVIGYDSEFWIPRINEYASRPLLDPSAKPVLEASNAVPLHLLRGSTATEAVEASHRMAYSAMRGMLTRNEPYDSPAMMALISNDLALGLAGDGNAKA